MKQLFLYMLIALSSLVKAQSVNNGNFSSGPTGWACNPEVGLETSYGGSVSSNTVVEIDSEKGLCQNISGFTVGSVYRLSFNYCRRTLANCVAPNPARGTVSISNSSAFTATFSSTQTTFAYQSAAYTFTPTSTSVFLDFENAFTSFSSCGIILDNISIVLYSGLPIELLSFEAVASGQEDLLQWSTASEVNSQFFTIERSQDGSRWEPLQTLPAAGTTRQTSRYATTVEPLPGITYYRLKQSDYDKSVSYSSIAYVERQSGNLLVFPNPATNTLIIQNNKPGKVELTDVTGRVMLSEALSTNEHQLDLSQVDSGVYFVSVYDASQKVSRKKLVVQK